MFRRLARPFRRLGRSFRRPASHLRAWFGGDGWDADRSADGNDGHSDPTAFSLLDASVNYSHGQSDDTAVRELQRANEQANELTDARRENR